MRQAADVIERQREALMKIVQQDWWGSDEADVVDGRCAEIALKALNHG